MLTFTQTPQSLIENDSVQFNGSKSQIHVWTFLYMYLVYSGCTELRKSMITTSKVQYKQTIYALYKGDI